MGMGWRRGGRRGRRVGIGGRRRVGFGRRRRGRWRSRGRRGGGGALLVLCCIGAAKAIHNYRKGVEALELEQKQIIEQRNQSLQLGQTVEQTPEQAEEIRQFQAEQIELLNAIMERQAQEKDPEKLRELIEQQNRLIANMQQMQTAGYQYQNAIPEPVQPIPQQQQQQQQQHVPMDAATSFSFPKS